MTDEVSKQLAEIEKRLAGIKVRSVHDDSLEYLKRGKFMVRDLEWLIAELKKARGE